MKELDKIGYEHMMLRASHPRVLAECAIELDHMIRGHERGGWELVCVIPLPGADPSINGGVSMVAYMKRPQRG